MIGYTSSGGDRMAVGGGGGGYIPEYINSWIRSRMKRSWGAPAPPRVVTGTESLGAGTSRGPTMKEAAAPR